MTRTTLRSAFIAAAATASLLLTGCGGSAEQAAEQAIESASGGDVDVDIEGETFTFENEEEGVTVQGGAGAELPEGFPADLPLPPAGEIMSAASTPEGSSVMWMWDGMTQDDFDQYIAQVQAAGYQEVSNFVITDEGPGEFSKSSVLEGNGLSVSVSGTVTGGSGVLSVVATQAQ